MALLTLVAMSGADGVSRERLMAMLWPESDQDRARNLLKVSVYVLRQALGDDSLLSEGDQLRLSFERVETDVATFEAALADGDHERAVALFDAPFLEGFFLSDAPDFERWVALERSRLASARSIAIEVLADSAQRRGNLSEAVDWWKNRAAEDPLDSRVAARLMEVLAASGNPAAALKHATLHDRLLHEELGIAAAPEVTALVRRLRLSSEPGTVPQRSRETEAATQAETGSLIGEASTGQSDHGATDVTEQRVSLSRIGTQRRSWRKALGYTTAAISLAVVVLIANRPGITSVADAPPSIAVLPLKNLSAESKDSLLADLMTEEIISALGSDPLRLRVIASTSMFQFRGEQVDVRDIAGRLGVAQILEGNLQKSDNRIRVRLRLVDAKDGGARWSKTFDREYGNLLSLQAEIAEAVALELGVRLTAMAGSSPLPGRPASDSLSARRIAAFELFVAATDKRLLRSDTSALRALDLLESAVQADSTYAPAHAALARMYQRVSYYENLSRRDRLAVAEQYARKSLALDEQLAEGHASLGIVLISQLRLAAAERALQRAIQLNPVSALPREFLVILYTMLRRPERALEAAQGAVRVDTQSTTAHGLLAQAFLQTGRCPEALEALKVLSHLRPPLLRAAGITAHCMAMEGKWEDAITVLRPDSASGGQLRLANLGFMLARSGKTVEARQILETLREGANRGDAYFVGVLYAGLHEFDEAFEWLGKAVEDGSLHHQILWPTFRELHEDPRFDRLWARLKGR